MTLDEYFLRIANHTRWLSPDPSSQIGAVIVNPQDEAISEAYNGFPSGVVNSPERWERPMKYQIVVHAEHRAILSAARRGRKTEGGRLYLVGMGPPTMPCSDCAKAIIDAGIVEVIGCAYKAIPDRWVGEFDLGAIMLKEAAVRFREVSPEGILDD